VGIGRGHEARTRAALFVFRAKDASAIMVPMRQLTLRMDACVETLALLIAMAWADGKLEAREKEGVRGAASVLNLTKELRERLDTLLDKPCRSTRSWSNNSPTKSARSLSWPPPG
jgi:hypothetical protein